MNKNVLYISYDGMTDPLGQSQVLPYLIGLSEKGFRISLLSFEKEERFLEKKILIQSICSKSGITWYPETYTKKPPIISTIKDIRKMHKAAIALYRKEKIDIIHCRSYISAIVGKNMKKRFNIPFIFDMRGFWADERVDGKLWNLKNPLYKLVYNYFKKKEKAFLAHADYTIALTHNAKNEILSWPDIPSSTRIEVIPCCVDSTLFDPAKISQESITRKRQDLKIESHSTIITYIGSIGTWYMLKEMFDFFKVWLQKNPNSVFLIVTPDDKLVIVEQAKDAGITKENIRVVQGAREEMPLYIKLGECSLFFIKPVYSKKGSSPTKQGEIMAMGVPVICNVGVGDTDYVVNKYKSGILVSSFSKNNYEKVCLDFIEKKESFKHIAIRDGAKEFFLLDNAITQYANIYAQVSK